jgi:PhoPQ-activated pathogenicity-related protein
MISIVDDRVTATVPIVINMLNMPAYIKHSLKVWGIHSPQIRDYSDRGILQKIDTPRGEQMFAMIDPYTYREHLDKPKLLVYGTNDPYWPVDSTRHYVADLPGETHLLFIPNQGHKSTMGGISLLIAASKAMHQSAATGERLASLDWRYVEIADALNITIESDIKPMKIEYWRATSDDRDFRDNKWRKKVLCGGRNVFPWTWLRRDCEEITVTDVTIPTDSCRAQFAQVYFKHDDFKRYPNSTDISVTGPARCIPTVEAEKPAEIAGLGLTTD